MYFLPLSLLLFSLTQKHIRTQHTQSLPNPSFVNTDRSPVFDIIRPPSSWSNPWSSLFTVCYACTSASSGGMGDLGCLLSKCCLKVLGSGIWVRQTGQVCTRAALAAVFWSAPCAFFFSAAFLAFFCWDWIFCCPRAMALSSGLRRSTLSSFLVVLFMKKKNYLKGFWGKSVKGKNTPPQRGLEWTYIHVTGTEEVWDFSKKIKTFTRWVL